MRLLRGFVCPTGLSRASLAVVCLIIGERAGLAETRVVPAGASLQAAINAAQPGDVIELQAGATYTGNFVLPVKSGASYITIRSTPDARLPGPGQRINPALHRALLAKIRSHNAMSALKTAPGAHHWRLQLLEFDANVGGFSDIIKFGDGDADQNSLSLVPYELEIDRCYIAGDPLLGQKRGIALNSKSTRIVGSVIVDIKGVGMDTNAICGWSGPGPYVIENNYFEAAGENLMFGGADPKILGLVPSDITLRLNHFVKPRSWQQPIIGTPTASASPVAGGTLPAGTYGYRVVARRSVGQGGMGTSLASVQVVATLGAPGAVRVTWAAVPTATEYRVYGRATSGPTMYWRVTGTSFVDGGAAGTSGKIPVASYWTVKNLFELKNARRVLVEGNVFEQNWTDGQVGIAITFKPSNQGTAPWTEVADVTFRHNIVRHAGGGINITGYGYNGHPSQQGRNVSITDNLFDDINTADGAGRVLQLGGGPAQIIFEHNTVLQEGPLVAPYTRNADGTYDVVEGFRFANNLALHSTYGIKGDGAGIGTPTILAYFLSPASVVRNVMAGGQASLYPADNLFPSVATFMSQFADASYRLKSTSPYKNAGTDGRDLGADIDQLKELTDRALSGDSTGNNAAPVADAGGPYAAPTLTTVTFEGGASIDPDGTIVSYRWNWGDGTPDGMGVTAMHEYSQAGTYTVTLTVTDDNGATASATTTASISISNQPPTANAGGPYVFQPGTALTVSGSGSSDLDGTIVSYRWTWGDGTSDTTTTSATTTHTYGAGGPYSIQLTVTDDAGAQATASTTATVATSQGPADLVLSALTGPGAVAPGVSVLINSTTRNQGAGTAVASATVFYLSTNTLLDSTDKTIGSRAISALAPGASSTGSASVTLPANTAIGSYFLLAKADGTSAVAESVETNNTGLPIQVRVGPDLAVSALTVPGGAAGATISIAETTANQGSAATPTSTTRFYLSANTQLDTADTLLGSRTVPALAAGASSNGTTAVVIPATTAAGTYVLIAVADASNGIVEALENNNRTIRALSVTP
jgi:PKD repeat protein